MCVRNRDNKSKVESHPSGKDACMHGLVKSSAMKGKHKVTKRFTWIMHLYLKVINIYHVEQPVLIFLLSFTKLPENLKEKVHLKLNVETLKILSRVAIMHNFSSNSRTA